MNDGNSKWITQKEASELSGKTLGAIHQLTRTGRLKIKERYGRKLVSYDEVVNFKPIRSGRPPKIN